MPSLPRAPEIRQEYLASQPSSVSAVADRPKRKAGRPKGGRNKKSTAQLDQIIADGITPLGFLLEVLRDENRDIVMRLDAAKAAAPYVHPRLAAVELKGDKNAPVQLVVNGSDVNG